LVGEIEYSTWSSKAEMDLNGTKYYWQVSNFWATKSRLEDQYGKEIHLAKNTFSVNQSHSTDNEFLFLIATFLLFNYQRKMMAAGAA
jgi:SET domain-containing protein